MSEETKIPFLTLDPNATAAAAAVEEAPLKKRKKWKKRPLLKSWT